jgi:SH3-like domain-containing protein
MPAAKPPAPFPTMGDALQTAPKTAPSAKTEKPPEQVAYLPPEEILPPPLESGAPKSKSLMNYVDLVLQVKKEAAPLFQNPGDTPIGASLPAGAKGHADFEVKIGEDTWYQVKSKKGTGWLNSKYVSAFNLSPGSEAPVVAAPAPPSSIEGGRKESTYFESGIENVQVFDKPSDTAKQVGTLADATPYLAIRSEKVGPNRWFQLQIRAGETAWARGLDLQLANVQQPNVLEIPTQSLSQRGKQSAFKAEWISAGVKGVAVYTRPSIVAKMVRQINPSDIFKVVESQSAGGNEWYRIELNEKLDGWVQTMDVKLRKGPK